MMNQGDLFRKLGLILNELNDQYEYLAQNPQKFNELELELFLANANFLADHIQIIRKLNSHKVPKELPEHATEPEIEVAEDEPGIPEPLFMEEEEEPASLTPEEAPQPITAYKETAFQPEPEPLSFEFILNERPQAESAELPQKEIAEVQQPVAEVHPAADFSLSVQQKEAEAEVLLFGNEEREKAQQIMVEEASPEPYLVTKEPLAIKDEDQVPPPSSSLVADKVEEKVVKPTLNDLLASTRKKDNADPSAVPGPPISDLKQAINLNDKLLYIKDLFNGYNLAYSEAIDLINKMPDFKTADAFLKNNYAVKNNWAARPATVDKFYDLLRRRF